MSRTAQALGWRRFLAPDAVAAVACLTRPRRVAACAARHRRADPSLTATGARVRARASYREYFRTCVDLAWAHDLEVEAVRRLHPIDGFENIDRARQEHGAGIFCLAHFGNWDMAATMALSHGLAVTTVMREFRPASLNRLIVWARERRGLRGLHPRPGRPRPPPRPAPRAFPGPPRRHPGGRADRRGALPRRPGALQHGAGGDGAPQRVPPAAGAPATATGATTGSWSSRRSPPGPIPEMTQALAERLDALIALAPDQWYPFNPSGPTRGRPGGRPSMARRDLRGRCDARPAAVRAGGRGGPGRGRRDGLRRSG